MILCMQEDVNSIMLYNNLAAMGIVSGIPFFSHPPHLDGKQMCYHYKKHMPCPSRITTAFIMGHTKIAFAFFKALFNRPAQRCCPIQLGIRDMIRCIGYKIFDGPILVSADI